MSEAEKHLRAAELELKRAKPHLKTAQDVQSLNEAMQLVDLLAEVYAEETKPAPRHKLKD